VPPPKTSESSTSAPFGGVAGGSAPFEAGVGDLDGAVTLEVVGGVVLSEVVGGIVLSEVVGDAVASFWGWVVDGPVGGAAGALEGGIFAAHRPLRRVGGCLPAAPLGFSVTGGARAVLPTVLSQPPGEKVPPAVLR